MGDDRGRGPSGEALACRYLEKQGLTVLIRGYRCRLGELDVVCQDGHSVVVVEVRARSKDSWVDAAASIDTHKQARIIRTTRHLLMTHPKWATRPFRFDVVALTHVDGDIQINWIQNAFHA